MAFAKGYKRSVAEAASGAIPFDAFDDRTDLIHCTTLPDIRFNSIKHSRRPIEGGSVPKVAFGKCIEVGGRFRMPVGIEVHHALVDGAHVGQFYDALEQIGKGTLSGI